MKKSLSSSTNYLPISEAAKYLGVSLDTLRRWDKSGIIKSQRLDGKNRYFSITDLKKSKSNRPLSISEVSKKLNISTTTLRRLEARGLITPTRNKAGERLFDSKTVELFLKSDYFKRKKYTFKKVKTSKKDQLLLKNQVKNDTPKQAPEPKPASKFEPKPFLGNFIAISSAVFVLLVTVGLGNIFLFKTQNYEMIPLPVVLGEKINIPPSDPAPQIIEPEETSSVSTDQIQIEEPQTPLEKYIAESLNMINKKKQHIASSQSDLIRLVEIAVASDSAKIAIRQNPDAQSPVIGSAAGGEIFEFLAFDSGWVQFKLHESTSSGFIQEKYGLVKEFNFSSPESGWSNINESTQSASLDTVLATKEAQNDQSAN